MCPDGGNPGSHVLLNDQRGLSSSNMQCTCTVHHGHSESLGSSCRKNDGRPSLPCPCGVLIMSCHVMSYRSSSLGVGGVAITLTVGFSAIKLRFAVYGHCNLLPISLYEFGLVYYTAYPFRAGLNPPNQHRLDHKQYSPLGQASKVAVPIGAVELNDSIKHCYGHHLI